jgi:inhibitor of growth protein 3
MHLDLFPHFAPRALLTIMPRVGRDDLTIDFVGGRNMPQLEHQDAAAVLDDFTNRVANLPAEIAFMQEEIAEKDRQMQECLAIITRNDNSIQKWIRLHGSHEANPREGLHDKAITENYDKAQKLQSEKLALTTKTQLAIDKHTLYLDKQIKALQDRGEFPNDADVPSLLRPQTQERTNTARVESSAAAMPLGQINNSAMPHTRHPNQHLMRPLPAQAQVHQQPGTTSSAPATPNAAAILLQQQRARESSMGAAAIKRQKLTGGLGITTNPSGLARHASLTPGTPRAGTPTGARAGSAGPRSTQKIIVGNKKVAPSGSRQSGAPRKYKPGKSGLSRVKRTGNKNSPSSTNDSELSEAETGSADEDDEAVTPPPGHKDGEGDDDMLDIDEDEGGDDKKYCTCQSVSYGDMVACDNESCPYEWFHWSCVGLKSEPVGTWICPVCTKNMKK